MSNSQTLVLPVIVRVTAAVRPSADRYSRDSWLSSASPTEPTRRPLLSSHTSCVRPADARNAIEPSEDAEKAAEPHKTRWTSTLTATERNSGPVDMSLYVRAQSAPCRANNKCDGGITR